MKNLDKEALFKDYVEVAMHGFEDFETLFATETIYKSLVGIELDHLGGLARGEALFIAEKHMKTTRAWSVLSEMYDYAVHGIKPSDLGDTDAVLLSTQIIDFLDTEKHSLCQEWQFVHFKANARYTLDEGSDLDVDQLAALAAVDVRTVRNAMSAGDLMSEKRHGTVYVNNKSARHWLVGRRGFKPTVDTSSNVQELNEVTDAKKFASFMRDLNLENGLWNMIDLGGGFAGVKMSDLKMLESGEFNMSLDKVFPIADLYGLDRTAFLKLIMTTFFPEEYVALNKDEEGGNEKHD